MKESTNRGVSFKTSESTVFTRIGREIGPFIFSNFDAPHFVVT